MFFSLKFTIRERGFLFCYTGFFYSDICLWPVSYFQKLHWSNILYWNFAHCWS